MVPGKRMDVCFLGFVYLRVDPFIVLVLVCGKLGLGVFK